MSSTVPLVGSTRPAGLRLALCLLIGVVVAIPLIASGHPELGPTGGWLVAAGLFSGLTLAVVLPLTAEQAASHALREDSSRTVTDVVVLVASLVSLFGVGYVLHESSHAHGGLKVVDVVVAIGTVVASWAIVHVLYVLRYARLYFSEGDGGIDFGGDERPTYADFAYLSFTIGMCFQVSDTTLQTRTIRSTALRHALLSYVFATGIVAVTINLVAGLVT